MAKTKGKHIQNTRRGRSAKRIASFGSAGSYPGSDNSWAGAHLQGALNASFARQPISVQ